MAIKTSFSIKDKKHCKCLKCGTPILPDRLVDNLIYICDKCGQKMTVDRYENRAVLTVIERPDLRRRIPPEVMDAPLQYKGNILKLLREKGNLKEQLKAARKEITQWQQEAEEWKQAANGLASTIEEMRAKEGVDDVCQAAGDTK